MPPAHTFSFPRPPHPPIPHLTLNQPRALHWLHWRRASWKCSQKEGLTCCSAAVRRGRCVLVSWLVVFFFVFLFFFLTLFFFSLFYSNLEVMLGVWRHWEDSTSSLNWGVCCRVLRTRKPQNLFCFSSFLRKLVYLIKCDSFFLFFAFLFSTSRIPWE